MPSRNATEGRKECFIFPLFLLWAQITINLFDVKCNVNINLIKYVNGMTLLVTGPEQITEY